MQVSELAALVAMPDLPQRVDAVEAQLRRTIEPFRDALGPAAYDVITAPGKRLRPALTIVMAHLGGVFDDRVVRAATAIELVQIGSLVHDDIIDGSSTRRGKPTINSTDGVGPAVVAGDLVLALAGHLAAELAQEASTLLADGMA